MAIQFEATTIPDLDASKQRAFLLADGRKVVVQITRRSSTPAEEAVPLKVRCWLANDSGQPVLDAENRPMECPAYVSTKMLSASLADGSSEVIAEKATLTTDAIDRFVRWAAAHEHWSQIPVED